MLMLEQDIIWKELIDKKIRQLDFDISNDKEYKVEVIWDSAVYAKKSKSDHLLRLYYIIS